MRRLGKMLLGSATPRWCTGASDPGQCVEVQCIQLEAEGYRIERALMDCVAPPSKGGDAIHQCPRADSRLLRGIFDHVVDLTSFDPRVYLFQVFFVGNMFVCLKLWGCGVYGIVQFARV